MGITTTESIKAPKGPRCDSCGRPAPGGVALVGDGLRALGICCATGWRREELLRMLGSVEPEEVPELMSILGHDPLNKAPGAHPAVVPIIEGVRKLNKFRHNIGISKQPFEDDYRSLTPEAYAEAKAGGFIAGYEPPVLTLNAPSIPPPAGQDDPLIRAPGRGEMVPVGVRRARPQ